METIEQLLEINPTLKLMLLNKDDNSYNKTGAIGQIHLDTGHSLEFVYSNYHSILKLCS